MGINVISVVYEIIETDFVVAGMQGPDTIPVIVISGIASNGVVVGIHEADAVVVVAGIGA